MKKTAFLVCFSISGLLVHAQLRCGTRTPLTPLRTPPGITYNSITDGEKYVQLYVFNIFNNAGTDSAWSLTEIENEFKATAEDFKKYGICLVFAGYKKLFNTGWLNFDANNIDQITGVPGTVANNAITIYLHKGLVLGGQGLNGIAYSIPSTVMSVSRGAINNFSIGHELGHCFGLYHTFETAYGLECPDGSNCTDAGDFICDTRATPDDDQYMDDNTNASCVYTGNKGISCNGAFRLYNPEVTNYMSYGRRPCRDIFSPNQVSRMVWNIDNTVQATQVKTNLFISGINGTTLAFTNYPVQEWNATSQLVIGDYNPLATGPVLVNGYSQVYGKAMGRVNLKPGTRLQPSAGGKIILSIVDLCFYQFNWAFLQ